MEGNPKVLEWSIDEVYEKIKEKYDENVADKFKGKLMRGILKLQFQIFFTNRGHFQAAL